MSFHVTGFYRHSLISTSLDFTSISLSFYVTDFNITVFYHHCFHCLFTSLSFYVTVSTSLSFHVTVFYVTVFLRHWFQHHCLFTSLISTSLILRHWFYLLSLSFYVTDFNITGFYVTEFNITVFFTDFITVSLLTSLSFYVTVFYVTDFHCLLMSQHHFLRHCLFTSLISTF